MSSRRGGGFKAPGNYEPNRGKKRTKGKPRLEGRPGDAGTPRHSGKPQPSADRSNPPNTSTGSRAGTRGNATANSTAEGLPALRTPPAALEAQRTRAEDVAGLSFGDLGLGDNIVRALAALGATHPFAIQAVTIPDAVAGLHVLGRGRTGSGKTIAFGAALAERLLRLKAAGAFPAEPAREAPRRGERTKRPERSVSRAPKALILAPTRELALQLDATVQPIARSVGLFTGQFVGGQPFEPQLHSLKRGVDIAIGTPGRIEDLAKRGHLSLGKIAVTVIDEADHMAELGFIEPVQRILRQTRRGGQRLLFSATLDRGVDDLVREFMPRPAVHEILEGDRGGPGAPGAHGRDLAGDVQAYRPPENVEHRVFVVLREHKDAALVELTREAGKSVVFCRTRAYAEHVTDLLRGAGLTAVPLHGNLAQAKRERNLAKFTEGAATVLVATDVVARGIHVDDIDLVLQADPPDDPKAYVHRAGRTGRVGRAGRVLMLIPRTRQKRTRELFELLGFEPRSFEAFVPRSEGGDPVERTAKVVNEIVD